MIRQRLGSDKFSTKSYPHTALGICPAGFLFSTFVTALPTNKHAQVMEQKRREHFG